MLANSFKAGLGKGSAQLAKTGRYELIDVLRGLAAFAVAWCHIVMNNPRTIEVAWLHRTIHVSAEYGYLGVYAFYVVSGFVIPLAMIRADYSIRAWGAFMGKRLTRLHPPYVASIGLALAVAWAATLVPSYVGIPFAPAADNLALHFFYLPTVFGQGWINPVYWSLLVEVEYYLTLSLAMPWLMRLGERWLAAALAAACLLPFALNQLSHLPYHAPYFVIGLALCFWRTGRLSPRMALAVGAFAMAMLMAQREPQYVIAAAIVLPFFARDVSAPRLLRRLGDISYSLYLVHYIVGWRAVRLLNRFANSDIERFGVYFVALAISIVVSVAFYWAIERPALNLASRIKLKRERMPEDATAAIPAP